MYSNTIQPHSRIVNTSSSGTITIIIDDDDSNDGHNDVPLTKSKPTSRPTSSLEKCSNDKSHHPVTVPKFIRSEPQIKPKSFVENKKNFVETRNIIKVGGNRNVLNGSPLNSQNPQNSQNPLNSQNPHKPCATNQSQNQSKAKHSHVSRLQPHYVVVNHDSNASTSTSSSSLSSSSLSSTSSSQPKPSPTKYRLWNQQQTRPASPVTKHSLRTESTRRVERMLPPEDTESDCMDDATFFKYLNLIPKNTIDKNHKHELNSKWPLRNIAKSSVPQTNSDGIIILPKPKVNLMTPPVPEMNAKMDRLHAAKSRWFLDAQRYNDRLNKFKKNLPPNQLVREKIQMDLEQLHKRLMAERETLAKEEEICRNAFTGQTHCHKHKHDEKSDAEEYLTELDLCSPMGRRVWHSLIPPHDLKELQIYKIIMHYERFCAPTRDVLILNVPLLPKSTTRITRSNTGFAGIDKIWGPRNYSHEYCFSREQRLEKYKRLETGLNWKSRILSMQCKPVGVGLVRITRCPCCLEVIVPEWGHTCHDSDCEDMDSVEFGDKHEYGDKHELNDEVVMEVDSLDGEEEVITAGSICWKCGNDDCFGRCVSKTRVKYTTPVLVFNSKETILNTKPIVKDTILVQQVFGDKINTMTKLPEKKSSIIEDDDDDDDEDIVMIQEVHHNHNQHLIHPKSPNGQHASIIIRYADSSNLTLAKKLNDTPILGSHLDSIPNDIIVVKKL